MEAIVLRVVANKGYAQDALKGKTAAITNAYQQQFYAAQIGIVQPGANAAPLEKRQELALIRIIAGIIPISQPRTLIVSLFKHQQMMCLKTAP